jgi:hypothetical protein
MLKTSRMSMQTLRLMVLLRKRNPDFFSSSLSTGTGTVNFETESELL